MIHRANSNPCGKCRTAIQCVVGHEPPCNMIMIAWRDEAARGVISEKVLMQLEEQYRAWTEE
jgi:hypothetical protein